VIHNCYASGISKYCALHPGDIILTGAPGRSRRSSAATVEVQIPGTGVLRIPVIGEE
jgi:2-keto-4-pentenoate hydratase/2-oxohepta-3-ene-1,7-dioic acid hydratase in catechol pathway